MNSGSAADLRGRVISGRCGMEKFGEDVVGVFRGDFKLHLHHNVHLYMCIILTLFNIQHLHALGHVLSCCELHSFMSHKFMSYNYTLLMCVT